MRLPHVARHWAALLVLLALTLAIGPAHAGKTLTRDFLIEHTSSYGRPVPTRSLDTHIKNLRRKIEPDPAHPRYLLTVHGVGYRFADA